MVATILSAFTVADIRKKVAFTALMLALYRLGAHIPVPGVNVQAAINVSPSTISSRNTKTFRAMMVRFATAGRQIGCSPREATALKASDDACYGLIRISSNT